MRESGFLAAKTRRARGRVAIRRSLALLALAALAAGVVGHAVGCGSGVSQVSAERFVLADAKGRTRAVLGTEKGDDPSLTLFDRDGVARAEFALVAGGWPRLVLHKAKDQPDGIEFIVGPDRAEIVVADGKGKSFLASKPEGRTLSISDAKGNFLAGIVVGDGADPVVELYGRDGKLLFHAPNKK